MAVRREVSGISVHPLSALKIPWDQDYGLSIGMEINPERMSCFSAGAC